MPPSRRGLSRTYASADLSKGAPSTAPPTHRPSNGRVRALKTQPPVLPPTSPSRPSQKKRARPLYTANTSAGATPPPEAASLDKNVPSTGGGDPISDEEQPPSKKSKANVTNKNDAKLQSGKRGGVQVPPRSPLPVRSNHVLNPGAPDKPNKRRTSAQVTAEMERKAALRREADALRQRQIEILAEMEAELENEDEDKDRNVVRTLTAESDVEPAEELAPINVSSSDSEYNGDSEVVEEAALKAPSKKAVRSFPGVVG